LLFRFFLLVPDLAILAAALIAAALGLTKKKITVNLTQKIYSKRFQIIYHSV